MAEKYGWTLDYIENLPLGTFFEYCQIEEGKAKARDEIEARAKSQSRFKARR